MKKYVASSQFENHEILHELLSDLENCSNEGIKLSQNFNAESNTNEQADLSGQLKRVFIQAQDLIIQLFETL